MPKFCEMPTASPHGGPIYVNPIQVRYIRPGNSNTCTLIFDDNQSTPIGLPAEQVRQLLDKALNETS